MNEFGVWTRNLLDKYGKINPSLMTDEEYAEWVKIAKERSEAEKQKKWYYEQLKETEEKMFQ